MATVNATNENAVAVDMANDLATEPDGARGKWWWSRRREGWGWWALWWAWWAWWWKLSRNARYACRLPAVTWMVYN